MFGRRPSVLTAIFTVTTAVAVAATVTTPLSAGALASSATSSSSQAAAPPGGAGAASASAVSSVPLNSVARTDTSFAPPTHPSVITAAPAQPTAISKADLPRAASQPSANPDSTGSFGPMTSFTPPTVENEFVSPGFRMVPQAASTPYARAFAYSDYDSGHNVDVEFGGIGVSGMTNDTWTWNGTAWTQQSPATSPPARSQGAMAYDAATSTSIIFGGIDNATGDELGDTWSWNGTTWTQLHPATSPPARSSEEMAYSPALGKIVMFGGSGNTGGTNMFDDTWTWNGTTWTAVTTPSALLGFAGGGFAYDSAAGTLVMFGGIDFDSGSFSNQTWYYGSSGWTAPTSQNQPQPRADMGLAYDPVLGRLVLFGGMNATTVFGDTWMWDGTRWEESLQLSQWGPDSYAMFVTAAGGNGQIVLQGGDDNGGYYPQTALMDWDRKLIKSGTPQAIDDRSTFQVDPWSDDVQLGRVSLFEPEHDGGEDDAAAVDDGVFVVAGR